MRLRTFTAENMPAALKQVRDALGDGAIILASETSDQGVSVTAAVEEDDEDDFIAQVAPPAPRGQFVPASSKKDPLCDELRHEVQATLRFHNMPELFIAKLMQKASDAELNSVTSLHKITGSKDKRQLYRLALEKLLAGFFRFSPMATEAPVRMMLVGAPGIGKTLTAAKVATRVAMEKHPLMVITTDNKRAGGIEQLQAFTNILGLRLQVAGNIAQLKELLEQSEGQSLVVDTAGCNPYDADELAEIAAYASLPGIEPILAMQAGTDCMESIDMAEAFASLPIKRLLVTRADTARRFGGVLAAAAANDLALCNASSSSSIIDTLQPMTASLLAQLLLRYQLNQ